MRSVLLLIIAMILVAAAPVSAQEGKLIVHEWGTFTSLQNGAGEALGGINVDDEPVPGFVHSLPASFISNTPGADESMMHLRTKGGWAKFHPGITLRLETPVVYFYDRRQITGEKPPIELSVTFNGGYLSQFYPNADIGDAPKQPLANGQYVAITKDTRHTLTWKGLHLGQAGKVPETNDKVWLAPREVKADTVTVGNESEKYVFYRGVGNLDGPLRIEPGFSGTSVLRMAGEGTFKTAWLVDVTPDGVAFRTISAATPASGGPSKSSDAFIPAFAAAEYSAGNLKAVRRLVAEALVADGLFAEEAEAMLNTWEASYFKQPGMRVLYIVPKAWTDKVLPLKVSAEAAVTRVMVGRIDLVTQQQYALLKTISKPEEVKQLGRFAAAILNDEQKRNPSPRLQALIRQAGLSPAPVVGTDPVHTGGGPVQLKDLNLTGP